MQVIIRSSTIRYFIKKRAHDFLVILYSIALAPHLKIINIYHPIDPHTHQNINYNIIADTFIIMDVFVAHFISPTDDRYSLFVDHMGMECEFVIYIVCVCLCVQSQHKIFISDSYPRSECFSVIIHVKCFRLTASTDLSGPRAMRVWYTVI